MRVIAATNRDLEKEVSEGRFREDLYYRLKVAELHSPPLRERLQDLPALAQFFIDRYSKKLAKPVVGLSPSAIKHLSSHQWPGNVRELEHTLEHAFILCQQPIVTIDHLPPEIETFTVDDVELQGNGNIDDPQVIIQALEKAAWNKTKAASLLGISRRSIYRKIKEHNIIESEA